MQALLSCILFKLYLKHGINTFQKNKSNTFCYTLILFGIIWKICKEPENNFKIKTAVSPKDSLYFYVQRTQKPNLEIHIS